MQIKHKPSNNNYYYFFLFLIVYILHRKLSLILKHLPVCQTANTAALQRYLTSTDKTTITAITGSGAAEGAVAVFRPLESEISH